MKRYIRFDDYPVRELLTPQDYRNWLFYILRLCGKYRVRYILGVIPEAVSVEQARDLCAVMRENPGVGRVVMHGFDHAYQSPAMLAREQHAADWGNQYKQLMETGGEFAGLDADTCQKHADAGDARLHALFGELYDPTHFIAPFNRYTEAGVEGLARTGRIQFVHSSDEVDYKFDHHGLERVVSHFKFGYNWAEDVAATLPSVLRAGEQITLHWFYDCTKRVHWREGYDRMLQGLGKDADYVVAA